MRSSHVYFLFLSLTILSCKKEFKSLKGTWEITSYESDSLSLDSLKQTFGGCFGPLNFDLVRKKFSEFNPMQMEGENCILSGRYSLKNEKLIYLEFDETHQFFSYGIYVPLADHLTWTINYLNDSNLSIECMYRKKKHLIIMEKI